MGHGGPRALAPGSPSACAEARRKVEATSQVVGRDRPRGVSSRRRSGRCPSPRCARRPASSPRADQGHPHGNRRGAPLKTLARVKGPSHDVEAPGRPAAKSRSPPTAAGRRAREERRRREVEVELLSGDPAAFATSLRAPARREGAAFEGEQAACAAWPPPASVPPAPSESRRPRLAWPRAQGTTPCGEGVRARGARLAEALRTRCARRAADRVGVHDLRTTSRRAARPGQGPRRRGQEETEEALGLRLRAPFGAWPATCATSTCSRRRCAEGREGRRSRGLEVFEGRARREAEAAGRARARARRPRAAGTADASSRRRPRGAAASPPFAVAERALPGEVEEALTRRAAMATTSRRPPRRSSTRLRVASSACATRRRRSRPRSAGRARFAKAARDAQTASAPCRTRSSRARAVRGMLAGLAPRARRGGPGARGAAVAEGLRPRGGEGAPARRDLVEACSLEGTARAGRAPDAPRAEAARGRPRVSDASRRRRALAAARGFTRRGDLRRAAQEDLARLAAWCAEGNAGEMAGCRETRRAREAADALRLRSLSRDAPRTTGTRPAVSRRGAVRPVARYAWGRDYHDVMIPRCALWPPDPRAALSTKPSAPSTSRRCRARDRGARGGWDSWARTRASSSPAAGLRVPGEVYSRRAPDEPTRLLPGRAARVASA